MLEPRMAGAGVDQIGKTKLPDIAQPLERGRIKKREDLCLHLHIAMDRIFDDLGIQLLNLHIHRIKVF